MSETLRHYLHMARTLPPRAVLRRAGQIARREGAARARYLADRLLPTLEASPPAPGEPLARYFPAPPPQSLGSRADEILARSALCLEHRFDLLGSGWVQVRHGMTCRGLEGHRFAGAEAGPVRGLNRANRGAARRVRRLLPPAYRPIDWHLDFKSGYRWPERLWYRDVAYGQVPGADVKVPWELSRMQHLAVLPWAFALARDGIPGFLPARAYAGEFRSQVLDFIAANPPRYGVAWACTMDTAIRAANWLAVRDLLLAAGAAFDPAFEALFADSVSAHARHIVANLEWSVELRGNHYLADLCGLLFAAAYLPRSPLVDAWLAFAVRELVAEVGLQFHADGSTFEASTGYHRLAGEMVLWTTALVLGLPAGKIAALREYDHRLQPQPPGLAPAPVPLYPRPGSGPNSPFPPWYFERLERLAAFTLEVADPAGRVPPIGDFDSGRFLKLWPAFRAEPAGLLRRRWANLEGIVDLPDDATYWREDHMDHRHLPAAASGLFDRADFRGAGDNGNPEAFLIGALAGGALPAGAPITPAGAAPQAAEPAWGTEPPADALSLEIPLPGGDLREGLLLRAWPGFGLYLFRSRRLHLLVRCGPVGQRGNGGHAHLDQLGLVLTVDGRAIVGDPGSFVYTPLPALRNQYRSVQAHFAPRAADGREPGRYGPGLFCLPDGTRAVCLHFGPDGFLGEHHGFGVPVTRRVEILADRLRVTDWGRGLALLAPALPPPGQFCDVAFSPGYGWRERR